MRRYTPELDIETARRMYALHTMMMTHIAQHLGAHLEEVYQQGLTEDDTRCLREVLEIMVSEKMCEV